MKRTTKLSTVVGFALLLSMIAGTVQAGDYSDTAAPQFPLAFYDVNVTTPQTMKDFLGVIDATYDLFISKGVPAKRISFVVSLRGLSVSFTTDQFLENDPLGPDIKALLTSLKNKKVRIEACIISCNWVGVDPDTLMDGIVVIDNAFASSIWYQRKGYALIPIHQLP